MSLQMIYGRSGSGKTTYLFDKLRESLEKDPDIRKKRYVIVPDQFSYMMERKILETFGETVVFAVSVSGFRMFSQRILERVGGIKRRVLSPVGRSMMIARIAGQKQGELQIYGKSAAYAGFSDLLSQTIKEFKDYAITPEDVKAAAQGMEASELRDKLEDLYLIYASYEADLHNNFIDAEDQLKIAAEKAAEADFLQGAEFYIDEFSDFTPMQLQMIGKMLKKGDTYITLTFDEGIGASHNGVFSLTRDTDDDLMELARELSVAIEAPVFTKHPGRFQTNPELGHIEKEFYAYPSQEWPAVPQFLRIRRCQDLYEEVEYVAKDILKRVREDGLRFGEVAILLRNMEDYRAILKSVADEYGIPVFIDARKEIDTNPLAAFVAAFFEIKQQNFTFDAVFKYLKTYLLPMDRESIDLLENYCLAHGIQSWKWKEEMWRYKVREAADELENQRLLNLINEIKDEVYQPLMKVYGELEAKDNVRDKTAVFYDFLAASGALGTFVQWTGDFQAGDHEKYLEYSGVTNALITVLDQMADAMGTESMTVEEFGNTLLVGLSTSKISVIPATLDQVIAGDISRVRSSTVKGIYIIGVNDGILPRIPESTGILTDHDRQTLRQGGLKVSQDAVTRAFYEQFYVYNALTIADTFLTLTYPIADHEGKSLRPSTVPGRLKKLFPKLLEEYPGDQAARSLPGEISGKREAFRELLGEIRRFHDQKSVDPVWKEIYSYFKASEFKDKLLAAEEGIRFTNYPAELKAESIDKLYGKTLNLTVSRLERYNACPFAYFVKYGLKAERRPEFIIDTPDIGILMHDVLDRFTRKISADKLDWKDVSPAYTERSINELMEEAVNEKDNSVIASSQRNQYLGTKVKRIIAASVEVIKSQIVRGDFQPLFSEVEFGKSAELKPYVLELDGDRKVNLSGRIDRIDVFRDTDTNYIRIIDYKSFGKTLTLKDIYYGLQLQLLVYLNVLLANSERILKGKTLPGAVLYLKLDKPLIEATSAMTDGELQDEIMKELKLKGLILMDAKIIRGMDKDMAGVSLVIPAKVSKGEVSLTENQDMAVTPEQFDILRDYVSRAVKDTCLRLLQGDISITPVKDKDQTACKWCPYRSICQFDTSLKGFDYKNIRNIKGGEAWALIADPEKGGIKHGLDE